MKAFRLSLLLVIGALFSQCAKKSEPAPKVDYDRKSAEIVQAASRAVVGDWTLRQVHVTAQSYNSGQRELGIVRDTVFEDFATLSIKPGASRRSITDPRYINFEGMLHFRTKTYPVQFEIMASPERVVNDKGPQAFFLLEPNGPIGSHPTEAAEQFLQYVGFIQENFSLEVVPGQPRTMTWRGLNRGIDKIELVK